MTHMLMWWSLPFIAIATLVISFFGSTRTRFTAGIGTFVFFLGFGVGQFSRVPSFESGPTISIVLASAFLETMGIGLLALAAILPPPRPTSTGYGAPPPGLYGAPPQAPQYQTGHQPPPAPGRYDHLPRAGEDHHQPGR